jgi:hypothetical protein
VLPFHGVVMQEQSAMILLNLADGDGGRARILKLVLNEFEVNSRGYPAFVRL